MDKKVILVTGVAGFIGGHMAEYLLKNYKNCSIIGLDKISYCSCLKTIKLLETYPNFIFIRSDITDLEAMDYVFYSHKIDYVLNFAAYTHVDHSFGNSLLFTKNNVLGTHVLLEMAKKYKTEKFVHVSTDEVYGNKNELSTEETILAPTNPYSASKSACEHLVMSYYISFGLNVIITRGNNVYGPRQYPEKLIPKFISHLQKGEDCPIHGSGSQMRSFLYTDDVVRAFDIILRKGEIGEVYNIGARKEYTVLEVFEGLVKEMYPLYLDSNLTRKRFVKDRDFNDHRYFISSEKLIELGWVQNVDFSEGIKKTVEWYRNNKDYFQSRKKMNLYSSSEFDK